VIDLSGGKFAEGLPIPAPRALDKVLTHVTRRSVRSRDRLLTV
jgi:hypothetical protein